MPIMLQLGALGPGIDATEPRLMVHATHLARPRIGASRLCPFPLMREPPVCSFFSLFLFYYFG
jgi:hypothetical protein